MSKIVSKFALAAGLVFAMALTFSCDDGGASALLGKWYYEDGTPIAFEFLKGGAGIVQAVGENIKDTSVAFSWKLADKRIVMTLTLKDSSDTDTSDYEISGKKLTLTDSKGKKQILVKSQEMKIEGAALTDNRDGKKYKTVVIGERTWMAENLNYEEEGSKCYNNDFSNCQKYGRLYNWNMAKKTCPSGWHLPNNEEWAVGYVGGDTGKKLKSKSGWDKDGNGTDDYGFSALPGGLGAANGKFISVGSLSGWWSATEKNSINAYLRSVGSDHNFTLMEEMSKTFLLSIRCVKDY